MKEYFIERFKTKSEQELDEIVENRTGYQNEAVLAAIELLNNSRVTQIAVPEELKVKKDVVKNQESDGLEKSFSPKAFFRTLSYREFITWLALTLLLLSFFEIINYYSDEYFVNNNWKHNFSFFLLVLLFNHVIYKFEHRRSNNLMGRSISDSILLMMVIFAKQVYNYLVDRDLSFDVEIGQFILLIIVIAFFIFFFESIVGILKYLLSLIRCQIF